MIALVIAVGAAFPGRSGFAVWQEVKHPLPF